MDKRILFIGLIIFLCNFNMVCAKDTIIEMNFIGDCTLGYDDRFSYINSFEYVLQKENYDYNYFFKNVKELFSKDDVTIGNLEGTFTNKKEKLNKKFCFKGNKEYVKILEKGNIDMVNLSNNHIYDYKMAGYEDTVNSLDESKVSYYGNDYVTSVFVKNTNITFLGYKIWSNDLKETIERDIREAKKYSDIIVMTFHWGTEGSNYPNNIQKKLGRFAIDKGCDLVVGHHPHVIQGIEKYKDKYIVYSLGNFVFGGNRNPYDKDTFIFKGIFKIRDNEIISDYEIIPCSISSTNKNNDYCPVILRGEERERVIKRIYEYSKTLKYGVKEILIK